MNACENHIKHLRSAFSRTMFSKVVVKNRASSALSYDSKLTLIKLS